MSAYVPVKQEAGSDWANSYREMTKKNWEQLEALDKEAKALGTLVNRYLKFPFADGYAIYIITKVLKKTVKVEVVRGIGDDWVMPLIGTSGSIPLDKAADNVYSRDAFDKIFKEMVV